VTLTLTLGNQTQILTVTQVGGVEVHQYIPIIASILVVTIV